MSTSKNNRILSIYSKLLNGELIRKSEEAKRLGVNERTIQRDLEDIKDFVEQRDLQRSVYYDRKKRGYLLSKGLI